MLARVSAAFRKPGAMVTTNTSGLPVHLIAEGMTEEFQQHWAGTHFFNPPRYLEIGGADSGGRKTSPDVIATLSEFCDRRLGKGVVVWERTRRTLLPIALARSPMLNALRLMGSQGMTVEEVDACTGSR